MTVQVTVGDASPASKSQEIRGTVTAGLASRRSGEDRVMIELIAKAGLKECTVQLTVGEAEILQGALDSIIFDAAVSGR